LFFLDDCMLRKWLYFGRWFIQEMVCNGRWFDFWGYDCFLERVFWETVVQWKMFSTVDVFAFGNCCVLEMISVNFISWIFLTQKKTVLGRV
jgi:hypothetical protein